MDEKNDIMDGAFQWLDYKSCGFKSKGDYLSISEKEGKEYGDNGYMRAVHVMLWAENNDKEKVFNTHVKKATILMEMRWDGKVGFPGGLIDPGESVIDALSREINEELNFVKESITITESHHLITTVHHTHRIVNYFYAVKLSKEQLTEIVKNSILAKEWGEESLGVIIVPLYTLEKRMGGLPSFLQNNFAGNARDQLLLGCLHSGILTENEVNEALSKSKQ